MRFTYLFFSLLLCITSYAQPNPINRRAMAIAGLAQGPFVIDNSPGLVLNFQSDVGVLGSSGTYPPAGNETVSWWTNQADAGPITGGGNGNLATNGSSANKPVFYHTNGPNGKPFVSFTNSPYAMLQPNFSPAYHTPDTMFAVLRYRSTGITSFPISGNQNSALQNLEFNASDIPLAATDGGGTLSANKVVGTNWFLVTILFNDGSTSIIRTNRVQANSGTISGGNTGFTWGTLGAFWDATFPASVEFAAFVYATNNLNNVGSVGAYWLTNIENTLSAKYGTP